MFARSLVVALGFASAALSSPAKRFNHIEVSVAGPASVDSVEGLKFTASVTNTGTESVRILNYGTVLDGKLPTRSFTVTKDGAAVDFTGIKLQVQLNEADDSAYTIIAPGETVNVEHNVAALYNFQSAGAGSYSFEPVTTFQVSGAEDTIESLGALAKVAATSPAVTVELKGDLARRDLAGHDKRAVVSCSTSSRASFISASYTEGKSLASIASSYIASRGASDSLYVSYFGASSTSTVRGVFNNVANENSASRTLSCSDPYGACTSGVIAYTLIATTNIYFCSIFYNEVATTNLCSGTSVASRNIRGGTTLHELTHATSGTDDVTYGCSADIALSDANSRINADNYNCFSTQVYANTQC